MRRLLLISTFMLLPIMSLAQSMYSDAIECMNKGEYADAKVYWEALNDRNNKYGGKIAVCNACLALQGEAMGLVASEYYTKAIEKYQIILSKNPSDQNARYQIERCKRLREEYLAANQLQTYTNSVYGYTFKHPAFISKGTTSTNEKAVFWSSDYNVRININTTIQKNSLTNTQILAKVAESYRGAEITYKVIKESWIVISGYLADGKTFYDKSIIATRKSQYNENVKILVSAIVTSPKNDSRGSTLAEHISKNLTVNVSGPSVKVQETDEERWLRAKRTDTKEAYRNYLTYAPTYSSHKEEAKARQSLCEAREEYARGLYLSAKKNFELAEGYMTSSDVYKYQESFYKYCISYNNSVEELQKFSRMFPNHPQIKVIKGCYVKIYCSRGQYSVAKNYVKNNYGIWFNENTPYSRKQWLNYIKDRKKQRNSSTSKSGAYKTTSNTVSAGMTFYPNKSNKKSMSLGYTFGLGAELSIPKLEEGGFAQIKVLGGLGDNYNRFNLLFDLTGGYSGDYGPTLKAKIAPRWNIVADEFYLYAQPEAGYDFMQGGAVYGGRIGFGWEYLGSISLGYLYNDGFGSNLWQLSYVYNWYW